MEAGPCAAGAAPEPTGTYSRRVPNPYTCHRASRFVAELRTAFKGYNQAKLSRCINQYTPRIAITLETVKTIRKLRTPEGVATHLSLIHI